MAKHVGLAIVAAAALVQLAHALGAAEEKPKLLSATHDWNDVEPEATKVGAVRRFFKLPTATMGELACHVTTLNPGETSHAPHRHPEEELLIVKEGTVESFIEGVTRRLGPGSVIFHASNELHGLRNVGEGPATYHVFKWTVGSASVPPTVVPSR